MVEKTGRVIANLIMPFDTDSLTAAKDYSGYRQYARYTGATWTNNGKVGGAYSFDGLDRLYVIQMVAQVTTMVDLYSSSLGAICVTGTS